MNIMKIICTMPNIRRVSLISVMMMVIVFRSPMINYSDNFEMRVHVVDADVTKIIPLDPEATIFQLCEDIRKLIREAQTKSRNSVLWSIDCEVLERLSIRGGEYNYDNRYSSLCGNEQLGSQWDCDDLPVILFDIITRTGDRL